MYEEIGSDKMYQLYCGAYPHMDSKTFKTFDDFCGKKHKAITKSIRKEKTTTEILKEVERVMNSTVRG